MRSVPAKVFKGVDLRRTAISWRDARDRGGGLLFALLFNALLLLALLTLAPRPDQRQEDLRPLTTFDVAAGNRAETAEKTERRREEKRQARAAAAPRERPVEVERRPEVETPLPFLVLDGAQMAAADIGRMPRGGGDRGAAGQGDQAAVAGPGEGPGGVQLFEAEWYRRPTHAELSTYVPGNAPAKGWGLVACKTVENYRVENCQMLGESPQGSGFARAVRLAAWQFLVRPPRVNGKPMVGSWVRIRIDYSQSAGPAGGDG